MGLHCLDCFIGLHDRTYEAEASSLRDLRVCFTAFAEFRNSSIHSTVVRECPAILTVRSLAPRNPMSRYLRPVAGQISTPVTRLWASTMGRYTAPSSSRLDLDTESPLCGVVVLRASKFQVTPMGGGRCSSSRKRHNQDTKRKMLLVDVKRTIQKKTFGGKMAYRFGAHMSITGGLHKAIVEAAEFGFDCVQLFTASPNRWPVVPVHLSTKN